MALFKVLILAAGLISSNIALAIFDAQLLVGQRSGAIKADAEGTNPAVDEDAKATEIQAAAHIDPIPLVPVAFGLYVSNQTYEKAGDLFKEAIGAEIGLQLYAWLPIGVAGLKPYAKLGFPVYSAIKADAVADVSGTEVDYSYILETAGPHIGIGVSWSPLPLVALLLEFDMGQQTIKSKEFDLPDTLTAAGVSEDALKREFDYNNTAILLGAQVGL